jgi:2-polyprenyl-6-methoxyphenol hydroxylase-like FAD-dependent oxidoreductase
METATYDVAVVGAGPVGMTLSLLLARRGWRVACIERWPSPYGRPRAVGIDFEAARVLQDAGVVNEVLAVSEQSHGDYDWRNANDERLLVIDHSGTGPNGWPFHVNFSQPQVEAVLAARVAATENITMFPGKEVNALAEDADGVTLGLQKQTRARESARGVADVVLGAERTTVRASYVVGCDGANSFVRSQMQTGMNDLGFFYDWLILDVIPHEKRVWKPRNLQICDPARPTTVVGGGPGRRRWEFMVLPGERIEDMNTEETAWRLLRRWDLGPHNATLERHTVYTFQARWARAWNEGRKLLAGDAAHLMPPFAGQGLCSGLRDAMNLTWKLDLVLRGLARQQLLDTYTQERAQHIQHAIHYSVELGKVICVLDPAQAAERDRRMTATGGDPARALPRLPKEAFESGIVYRDHNGRLLAPSGEVAPQYAVTAATGTGRFDDVYGTSFALLSREPLTGQLTPENLDFLHRVGCHLVTLLPPSHHTPPGLDEAVDLSNGYHIELSRLEADAALIRPDGYYFGVAKSVTEANALVDQFKSIILGAQEGRDS